MSFITVEATVERVVFDGKGIGIVEEFTTKDGEVKTRKFTAWFTEAPGLEVGATGQFVGSYSDKVDEFVNDQGETIRFVARSINNAKFKAGIGHTLSKPVESAPVAAKGWADPALDAGAPF